MGIENTKELNCKEILTVDEVAEILQLNKETVLRYIRSGKLVAMRMGRPWRIRREDLNTLLINKENQI